jgi:hypothetical protein
MTGADDNDEDEDDDDDDGDGGGGGDDKLEESRGTLKVRLNGES